MKTFHLLKSLTKIRWFLELKSRTRLPPVISLENLPSRETAQPYAGVNPGFILYA